MRRNEVSGGQIKKNSSNVESVMMTWMLKQRSKQAKIVLENIVRRINADELTELHKARLKMAKGIGTQHPSPFLFCRLTNSSLIHFLYRFRQGSSRILRRQ